MQKSPKLVMSNHIKNAYLKPEAALNLSGNKYIDIVVQSVLDTTSSLCYILGIENSIIN
jgi:hypothetical protein